MFFRCWFHICNFNVNVCHCAVHDCHWLVNLVKLYFFFFFIILLYTFGIARSIFVMISSNCFLFIFMSIFSKFDDCPSINELNGLVEELEPIIWGQFFNLQTFSYLVYFNIFMLKSNCWQEKAKEIYFLFIQPQRFLVVSDILTPLVAGDRLNTSSLQSVDRK